ncbi:MULTISPECIES: permease-like cell division protein FtsX [unclassified Arcicella]|uniref:cell division protein FtsX n=1 Tax=unclassified Arcicella TaxID=2644986 RepID=UPI0028541D99|nr:MULTISPECIES: permease-like cell division protein FtsX [unclassified Arcicella]MDR6562625.1 cell division transport system permease protein [Arcicella sp. BE51]MDR6812712.1 cell division transport system permease protein [Arcicella sp. BE140]MDR6824024.1 cell division transport system permease protein [Arcicella sp. BE139]
MAKIKKLGSTPNVMVVISLTIALFLIGMCGLLTLNARKLAELVKQNVELQVYLDDDLTTSKLDSIYKLLTKKEFVLLKDNSPQINFISKEVAAKQFIEESGEDYRKLLGDNNPLHNLYAVKIKQEYFNDVKLKEIKTALEVIPGVHEVAYVENFVEEVNKNISKIYLVLSVFVLLLLLIIIILVNNTIKLSLYSQRFLIRSMQLVGATNGFIRKPFIIKGALQGLTSGLVASSLLILLQQLAVRKVEGLVLLQEMDKMIYLLLGILIIGTLMGILSTFQSVERYLRLSLDELY